MTRDPETPCVVIRLHLEAAPRVYIVSQNESEERRLADWIVANPDLARIYTAAIEASRKRVA